MHICNCITIIIIVVVVVIYIYVMELTGVDVARHLTVITHLQYHHVTAVPYSYLLQHYYHLLVIHTTITISPSRR